MRLLQLRTLGGPSVHRDRPVLVARLAAEEAAPDGFAERLAAWLGSTAPVGDGASRLPTLDVAAAAGAAHPPAVLAAASALRALAARAGLGAPFVQATDGPEPGTYSLVVARDPEPAVRALVALVVEGVAAALDGGEAPDLDARLAEIRDLAEGAALGPSTAAIIAAAERRGIPWTRLNEQNLIRLGWGTQTRFLQASITGESGSVAVGIACDKTLTKQLLGAAFLPVPRGSVVRTEEGAVEAAEELGYPVVVKPEDGNHGRGVSVGLQSAEAVRGAFAIAQERSRRVIVEQQFTR